MPITEARVKLTASIPQVPRFNSAPLAWIISCVYEKRLIDNIRPGINILQYLEDGQDGPFVAALVPLAMLSPIFPEPVALPNETSESRSQLKRQVADGHSSTQTSSYAIAEGGTSSNEVNLPGHHPAEAAASLAQVPIIYHYLTFETSLPSPYPSRSLPSEDSIGPPDPPDLQKYASPFTWSESRKRITTWLSCAVTVTCAYSAGSYSPASNQLSEYWGVSQVTTYVGITTFTTGFAIAPMVLAPFSEINGRYPVFVATGALFVACQFFCAICRSFPGMLIARFFVGVGGSTFSTMVGGVVSDIYLTADRNQPMTLFTGTCSEFDYRSMIC